MCACRRSEPRAHHCLICYLIPLRFTAFPGFGRQGLGHPVRRPRAPSAANSIHPSNVLSPATRPVPLAVRLCRGPNLLKGRSDPCHGMFWTALMVSFPPKWSFARSMQMRNADRQVFSKPVRRKCSKTSSCFAVASLTAVLIPADWRDLSAWAIDLQVRRSCATNWIEATSAPMAFSLSLAFQRLRRGKVMRVRTCAL